MGYALYENYTTTRHLWIRELPASWNCASLRLISKRYSGGTPDKQNSSYWQEGTIPWLNSGEVNQGTITTPTTYITEEALKGSSAKWIPSNSIIIALAGQGKTKATAAYTQINTTCNQSMAAVIFENDNSKYMYWWLKSQYKNIRGMASDDGRDGLNLEMIGSIPCPRPSITEQTQIAEFLDYKTIQIDCLIEKKKALIEKLKEQRIAIITHAVTKGLNPNAPMKDSEVDWLGKVPEHWEVKRLRFSINSNPVKSEIHDIERSDMVSFVPMDAVAEYGGIRLDTNKLLDDVYEGYTYFRNNDVVIAKITPCFENGKGALASNLTNSIAFGTTELHVMRTLERYSARWLFYLSISHAFREIGASEMFGAGGQKRVPESFIKDFRLGIPDFKEQEFIADYLDNELKKIDDILTVNNKAINRLGEYRTALITATVTGKIDVREVKIPTIIGGK